MGADRILIADSDKSTVELLEQHLQSDGFETLRAYRGLEALDMLMQHNIQLVVMAVFLPDIDGITLCKRIRSISSIPIMMLGARKQDMDEILALSTGADDYVAKPFNPLVALARVKALLRRHLCRGNEAVEVPDKNRICIGKLVVELQTHHVRVGERVIELTPTEYGILYLLASNPGRVFSAEEIFAKVWKERIYDSNNTVMVHIRKLREKLEDNPKEPQLIKTVWGTGYKIDR